MQNPNEDTEWNDVLREKGILGPKKEKEITEDQILQMLDNTVKEKTGTGAKELGRLTLDELDELEDEEEERVLLEYRNKRIQEMKVQLARSKFGQVIEITGQNYVQEVNKAGEGVWVVLHLYRQGIPMCSLLNSYMGQMAAKFPTTKFIKSISTVCIPNYPDKNVPTIFIYYEGEMKKQYIGADELRGVNLTIDEFEYVLGKSGAVSSSIKKDPKPKVEDKMLSSLGVRVRGNSDSEDDQ